MSYSFPPPSDGATTEKVEMSHTMYADDLIICVKSIVAAQKMLDGVRGAFATAGLRVNPISATTSFKKVEILAINCPSWTKH